MTVWTLPSFLPYTHSFPSMVDNFALSSAATMVPNLTPRGATDLFSRQSPAYRLQTTRSPAGLVIRPNGISDLEGLVRDVINNEPAIPNSRIVLDMQGVEPAPLNVPAAFSALKRLADETGVTICIKINEAPYAYEFVPAVVQAQTQEGIAWALGAKRNRIDNPELKRLIREIFISAPPRTYEGLFKRLLNAGVSPSVWELPMSIISNGGGRQLIGVHMEDLDRAIIDLLGRSPKSHTKREFRTLLKTLPRDIQKRARETYELWRINPAYAALRFNMLDNNIRDYFSIDVAGNHWKAVGLRTTPNTYTWIWIGSHESYNKFYRNLQRKLRRGQRKI